MKNKLIFIISLSISIILLITLFYYSYFAENELIGGQRDEHGCLNPAGYSYNETLGVCVGEWELNNTQREAIKIAITPKIREYGLTIIEVSKDYTCLGCFIVTVDVLGHQRTIGIYSWDLIDTSLTSEECLDKNGRNLNVVTKEKCYANETNIGKVTGFISPNICCVPNSYCGEDRGNYCIQIWEPVCGFGDFGSKTFSNSCVACLNTSVEYYINEECQ